MNPKHQLLQEVFKAELEEINQRTILGKDGQLIHRRDTELIDFDAILVAPEKRSEVLHQVLEDIRQSQAAWNADTSVAHKGLVGLAFSGGGIRSATVNLGVLQGLRKLGLLKAVDYLSTVSGGGYIGSCYSAVNAATSAVSTAGSSNAHASDAPDAPDPSAAQTANNATSNPVETKQALAHDALFQHQPGVPENPIFRHLRNNANYMAPNGLIDVLRVPAVFLRGMVINFLIVFPFILLFAALSALLITAPISINNSLVKLYAQLGLALSPDFIFTKSLIILTLLLFIVSPIANLQWNRTEKENPHLASGENTGWQMRNVATRLLGWCVAAIAASFVIELQPLAIALYGKLQQNRWNFQQMALAGSAGGFALSGLASKLLPKLANTFSRLGVYLVGLIGFLVFWLFYLHLSNDLLSGANATADLTTSTDFQWRSPLGFTLIAAALLLFAWLTGDSNFTSISRFYRDRLSKAYIFGFNAEQKIEQTDTLKLSALDSHFTPYHLLNSTLNLSRTSQAYSDDRRGDFFFFSKRYVGSVSTGYCKTTEIEKRNPEFNLATAMAISAAAAAPNLGKNTVKPLVFILGMLNIRYDYWLQNPAWINQAKSISQRPGPAYFLRELGSNLSADTSYVNLSDGGHIENLGIYELIRRECRLIIAGDSEEDLTLTFSGLADLIRLVQIDFGVIIVMDGLDEIRDGKQHYAIGNIYYRNEKLGKLIYLKTSLTGDFSLRDSLGETAYSSSHLRHDDFKFDNNPYLAHYKTQDPTFPHQSSANQFYDETQFECYRALGFQMVSTSLGRR
ncbi:patatin-like phospholipase family protein [Undibacterium flavidum]|uniref:Patatin-like phospholipase family protein n=1 Tax=Undibacterium flavidum TaxID=2762297 RepID=A0ABR6YDL9_9BURK|nr:patatin-like phospholipase family protein [Undibacterium flavidum]MBC3874656.1 patatin-like phospholipase family protein [Undibacterium flavidum]